MRSSSQVSTPAAGGREEGHSERAGHRESVTTASQVKGVQQQEVSQQQGGHRGRCLQQAGSTVLAAAGQGVLSQLVLQLATEPELGHTSFKNGLLELCAPTTPRAHLLDSPPTAPRACKDHKSVHGLVHHLPPRGTHLLAPPRVAPRASKMKKGTLGLWHFNPPASSATGGTSGMGPSQPERGGAAGTRSAAAAASSKALGACALDR